MMEYCTHIEGTVDIIDGFEFYELFLIHTININNFRVIGFETPMKQIPADDLLTGSVLTVLKVEAIFMHLHVEVKIVSQNPCRHNSNCNRRKTGSIVDLETK